MQTAQAAGLGTPVAMEEEGTFCDIFKKTPSLDPVDVLCHKLNEELGEDAVKGLSLLTSDKYKQKADQETPTTIREWSESFEKNNIDPIPILLNAANGPLGQISLDDGTSVQEAARKSMESRRGFLQSRSLSMSRHRKDEHFQGREKEIQKALNFLSMEFPKMLGLEIHGETAMGKTSLAAEICFTTEWDLIQVDNLRGKRTVRDLYLSILHFIQSNRLSCVDRGAIEAQFIEGFSQPEDILLEIIIDELKQITRDTILFLDNIDDICHHSPDEMMKFFRKMLCLKTKKVKLLWTVQESQLKSGLKNVLSIEVTALEELPARLLLKSFTKKKDMQFDPEQILQLCHGSPLVIKALVNQLLAETLSSMKRHIYSKYSHYLFPSLTTIFDELPDEQLRTTLVKLSVLETTFDAHMASCIIYPEQNGTAKFQLNQLAKVMFIQTGENRSKFGVSFDNALYSLHPLVLSFLKDLCSRREAYRQLLQQAENSFVKLFQGFITRLDEEESWWCAHMDNAHAHYIRFFDLFDQGQIEIEKKETHSFYEKLFYVATFAVSKNERENFLIRLGNGTSSQFSPARFNADFQRVLLLLRKGESQKEAKSVIDKITAQVKSVKGPNYNSEQHLCLANYHYAKGLFSIEDSKSNPEFHDQILTEAVTDLKLAVEHLKQVKEKKFPITKKSNMLNAIGHAYYALDNYKDAFEYHREAHKTITATEHCPFSSLRFVSDYLFNMGNTLYSWGKKLQKEKKPKMASEKEEKLKMVSEKVKKAKKCVLDALMMKKKSRFNIDLASGRYFQLEAEIHQTLKEYEDGERAARDAFRIWRKRIKPPSQEFINTLLTLGLIQFTKSRKKEFGQGENPGECGHKVNKEEYIFHDGIHYNTDCLKRCKRYCEQLVRILVSSEHTPVNDDLIFRVRRVHYNTLKRLNDEHFDAINEFYQNVRDGEPFHQLPIVQTIKQTDISDDVYALSDDDDVDEDDDDAHTTLLGGKQESGFYEESDVNLSKQTRPHQRGLLRKQQEVDYSMEDDASSKQELYQKHQTDSGLGDSITSSFETN